MQQNLLLPEYHGMNGMRDLYAMLNLIPTSENADVVLIRSHVAYWSGQAIAQSAVIKPSRGSSYKVCLYQGSQPFVVRITNYYDHREGVRGWTTDTRVSA